MSPLLRNVFTAMLVAVFIGANPQPAVTQKAKPTQSKTGKAKSKDAAEVKHPASPCQGLLQSSCETKRELCSWISPKKKVDKRGRQLTAYCRKKSRRAKAKQADMQNAKAKSPSKKK